MKTPAFYSIQPTFEALGQARRLKIKHPVFHLIFSFVPIIDSFIRVNSMSSHFLKASAYKFLSSYTCTARKIKHLVQNMENLI